MSAAPEGNAPPAAEPQAEHAWLHRLVGEWTSEMEATMAPGQPPVRSKGSERVRSLGGLWVVAEGEGEMPGAGSVATLLTLGFDPRRQRFVGTFVASMMTQLWSYDGVLDADGRLTLDTEGPDFSGTGEMARYQDVIEFEDDNRRVMRSRTLGADGQWVEFMTARYRRKIQ